MFKDATSPEIESVMQEAWGAFQVYREFSLSQRATFLRAIALEIENIGDELLKVAAEETHLPEARLRSERGRTMFQLVSYADACEKGDWLEARIDTANKRRNPPKPDIRKMLVPLGPVIVFGAANFPFAYSTAGGDTACALAAGCPVIVKAHPGHAQTSEMVASAVSRAAVNTNMPKGIFSHVHGASYEVGKALVEHPHARAIGFTGSYIGGKQIWDWANQRKMPIPMFAEMSSVNPIFLLPGKLNENPKQLADMCAASVTLGVGQFCTNPGLIISMDNSDLKKFMGLFEKVIRKTAPTEMLNTSIFKNYVEKRANALSQEMVETIAVSETDAVMNQGAPTLASTTGEVFINNPILHKEVFGPFSLVVRCKDLAEMLEVARSIEGQLTATIMGTPDEVRNNHQLVEAIKQIAGRIIMNGVPTGVEVCLSMQHGGPFPATTDSRFTAVGADGIKRFARPVAYQNWNDDLLPDELKNNNPLKIGRVINGIYSKKAVRR